ncbi:MAG: hypothetical protein AVDCRST_MAG74-553 [uncultured Pyrinomonadaceae bacterium]|uniref:Uncharacterized protein n=1 Tax=uncultured Pyrinomonadaceae bacterium TaxID=2283094 RepID=A0A6J4NBC3_9BACT|nr:MAG: hypothetical protein AVDCRST_MAG74-553 [uncultured Pyrinomonadaceae bacterium]
MQSTISFWLFQKRACLIKCFANRVSQLRIYASLIYYETTKFVRAV